jgi:hypothetical protein
MQCGIGAPPSGQPGRLRESLQEWLSRGVVLLPQYLIDQFGPLVNLTPLAVR